MLPREALRGEVASRLISDVRVQVFDNVVEAQARGAVGNVAERGGVLVEEILYVDEGCQHAGLLCLHSHLVVKGIS